MTEQQNLDVTFNKNKVFIFLLAIMGVIAITVGGYIGWELVTERLNAFAVKTEETYSATKQLQVRYEQLQNNLQELQQEIQRSNIAKTRYWKPIVIEHLIHLADLTLNTTRDTKLALAFLTEAKQYADGPELSAINYALTKDMANLQVVPVVDASELILKIETISQKISSLPMVSSNFVHPDITGEVKEPQLKNFWHRFFTSTINALRNIVVIRNKSVDVSLSLDQEATLRLEIQTILLQAQLAVMQRKNKVYHACLERSSDLFARYFVANQSVASDILPLLQELQQVDLEPNIAFPTESMAAINNFMYANKITDEETLKPQVLLSNKDKATPLL